MMNVTETVKQLLIINILFFIGSQFVPVSYEYLALHYFESQKFHIWQPITHLFMHAGLFDSLGVLHPENISHIAFNMFALYSFGSALEHFWGGKKFLFFYISCGLGAALIYSVVNYYQLHQVINVLVENGKNKSEVLNILYSGQYLTNWEEFISIKSLTNIYAGTAVGASGAIYGLLVAFAFMFPNAELALLFLPIPIKAKYFVPVILLFDLYSGLNGNSIFGTSTGIAHFAHLGGALFGFIMMWYWKKNQFNANRWN